MTNITTDYFKEYRTKLGFSNKNEVKNFFSAKDVAPTIDYAYIELLNNRLIEIVKKIDELVVSEIRLDNIDVFCNTIIKQSFVKLKQHKVLEARRIRREENITSMVVHFDFFNGQVAFVNIDEIEESDVNWITRQQMEGQTVFNIDQNYFVWKLTENPPSYKEISSL
ncbi:hypothetical protein AGMMS49938_01960 [Fibrobacterales bacterium]|nr:hypothetical protein AGMMS49938_01960 [Fibrobacterales bacterium]